MIPYRVTEDPAAMLDRRLTCAAALYGGFFPEGSPPWEDLTDRQKRPWVAAAKGWICSVASPTDAALDALSAAAETPPEPTDPSPATYTPERWAAAIRSATEANLE